LGLLEPNEELKKYIIDMRKSPLWNKPRKGKMKYYTKTKKQAEAKAKMLRKVGSGPVSVRASKANPPYKYVVIFRR
jgi:hypothetical protein